MRIAIAGNFGLTGKQTMAARALPLAMALAARGHSISMALPIRRESDRQGPAEEGGVRLMYAGPGPRLPGLAHLWQTLHLAWFCWRWRPDALYCFKPIAYSGSVLALFHLLRRLGLFRGTLALDTDDWEGKGGWNQRQPFPGWLKRWIAWQEAWSLRHADVVTVASRALVELAERAGARKVVYLPNALAAVDRPFVRGIEAEQRWCRAGACPLPPQVPFRGRTAGDEPPPYTTVGQGLGVGRRESEPPAEPANHRTALAALGERPVVLLYTRFFEFGLERLLDSFESILERVPDTLLLVVGEGLEGEERHLQRMAAERGIRDRLVMAGWVPPDRLPDYFHAAHVALYPMDDTLLNRAKCPVKLLDLLAAGVPVVADRVGQAAEYIQDERTGLLVDPGHAQAMAAAAAALLADPALRAAFGAAARSDVRERWQWSLWAPVAEAAIRGLRTED